MISSMTGYGNAELQIEGQTYFIEIKTLNSKFCEVKTRLPAELTGLDIRIQQYVRDAFNRGRIDVLVAGESDGALPQGVSINWPLAEQYLRTFEEIKQRYNLDGQITLDLLTRDTGVLQPLHRRLDLERVWESLTPALGKAVKAVAQMRRQEGESIAADLKARLQTIDALTQEGQRLAPEVVDGYRQRIMGRVKAICRSDIDEQRLLQEVALLAERTDITEETVRIRSHLDQFLALLEQDAPVGRTMDFLAQELNREVNTLASKANSAAVSQLMVTVKAELEKVREQAQNVE